MDKLKLTLSNRIAIQCLVDDVLCTFLKTQAVGEYSRGEILVLTEDAYGDTALRVRMLSEVMLELKMFCIVNELLIEIEKQFGTMSSDQSFKDWAHNCRFPDELAMHIRYIMYLNHLLHSVKKVPPIPDELK